MLVTLASAVFVIGGYVLSVAVTRVGAAIVVLTGRFRLYRERDRSGAGSAR